MRVVFLLLVALALAACDHETIEFQIADECGPIQGAVMHAIKDTDACRIRCRGQCESMDYEFAESTFIDQEPRCHLCNCTCMVP